MIRFIDGDIKYIDGLFALLKNIRQDFKLKNIDIYQEESYPNRDLLLADLKRNKETILALDGEVVVGFMTSEPSKDFFIDIFQNNEEKETILKHNHLSKNYDCYISYSRLMVDPNSRKKGIATNLMKMMDEKYKGKEVIFLVDEKNNSVFDLYDKLGYKKCHLEQFIFGKFYVYTKKL